MSDGGIFESCLTIISRIGAPTPRVRDEFWKGSRGGLWLDKPNQPQKSHSMPNDVLQDGFLEVDRARNLYILLYLTRPVVGFNHVEQNSLFSDGYSNSCDLISIVNLARFVNLSLSRSLSHFSTLRTLMRWLTPLWNSSRTRGVRGPFLYNSGILFHLAHGG